MEREEEDEWREPRYGAKEIQREERRAGRGVEGRGGEKKREKSSGRRNDVVRRCTTVASKCVNALPVHCARALIRTAQSGAEPSGAVRLVSRGR